MIKNLIFDFGNVLVNQDLQAIFKENFEKDKEIKEQCLNIVSSPEFTEAWDRGLIPFDELIKEIQMKHPRLCGAFHFFRDHCMNEVTGEIEGMRNVLIKFKAEGFKLYGLSNWGYDIYEVMQRHAIFSLLDGQVISCEEHLIKPENEIYLRLCKRYRLLPSECLFTDDRLENIKGAKTAGMHAVLFTTPENYVSNVKLICSK